MKTSRALAHFNRALFACLLAAMAAAGTAHADPSATGAPVAPVTADAASDTQADPVAVHADDADAAPGAARSDSLGGPDEPVSRLESIDERTTEKDSLFAFSPLGWLVEGTTNAKQAFYDATRIKLGAVFAHVFQGLTDSINGEDDLGAATTMDLIAIWDLFNTGERSQAQLVAHVQSRFDFGTTGPEELGGNSLGSIIGTADTFSQYSQLFVTRNLYWRQGSPETGWVYRLGKITPDAILSSSPHLDSQSTFLPSGGTGPFAIALPDSGIGAIGGVFFGDRAAVAGLISDANGDRTDWGDVGEGDLFKAVELHVKVAPRTAKAPYSKLTFWHTDGTEKGNVVNAQAGPSGWGIFAMHQQELSADGRWVGILRYGHSFDDAAVYDDLAAAHLLLYEPRFLSRIKHDAIGAAFNWAQAPAKGSRSEYHLEVFYRFPLFPNVDTTVSYQSVINPALTNDVDHASVFSLRLRVAF